MAKITSSEKDIIDAGIFTTFGGSPTTIELPIADGIRITLKFENTQDKQLRVDTKELNKKEIEMTFFNFNNPFGSGNLVPFPIASMIKEKSKETQNLYVIFRINSFKNSESKTIQYTFFLGN